MPVEIVQANKDVAEVRVVCDQCNRLVWSRIVWKSEAKTQRRVVCQRCQYKNND